MLNCFPQPVPGLPDSEVRSIDEEVVEVTILMLQKDARRLEKMATSEGISLGRLFRRLIARQCREANFAKCERGHGILQAERRT
jgi:hypothetical protein